MTRWTRSARHLLALALGLSLLGATSAGAEGTVAIVLEKNPAQKTLTLDNGRILKVWRWERPFYKFAGTNWKLLADDAEYWHSRENEFLNWRSQNR